MNDFGHIVNDFRVSMYGLEPIIILEIFPYWCLWYNLFNMHTHTPLMFYEYISNSICVNYWWRNCDCKLGIYRQMKPQKSVFVRLIIFPVDLLWINQNQFEWKCKCVCSCGLAKVQWQPQPHRLEIHLFPWWINSLEI